MRARNIKPGFFLNCELAEVDFASRILFIGLWCYADREGRFKWKPKQIKATVFPYDNVNIEKLLGNLMSLHFITRNDTTGYVEHFKKHQNPHPHEAKSILPEKSNEINVIACNTNGSPCNADIRIADTRIPDIRIEDASVIAVPVGPSRPRAPKFSDDEWMNEIKINPAYAGIDIERELGKCQAWCMTKNKRMSRPRILNWLNGAEKPFTGKIVPINRLSTASNHKSECDAIIEGNKAAGREFVLEAMEQGGI